HVPEHKHPVGRRVDRIHVIHYARCRWWACTTGTWANARRDTAPRNSTSQWRSFRPSSSTLPPVARLHARSWNSTSNSCAPAEKPTVAKPSMTVCVCFWLCVSNLLCCVRLDDGVRAHSAVRWRAGERACLQHRWSLAHTRTHNNALTPHTHTHVAHR